VTDRALCHRRDRPVDIKRRENRLLKRIRQVPRIQHQRQAVARCYGTLKGPLVARRHAKVGCTVNEWSF
jgi:hypothetical protein